MAQGTVIDSSNIQFSEVDPTENGQIIWTSASLVEIEDCDATTNWSMHSGTGFISVDTSKKVEGTGSIKVLSGDSGDAILKATVAAKDLTGLKSISLSIWRSNTIDNDMTLYFGEAAYNEQSNAITVTSGVWNSILWDISAIANANKNAVTLFAIKFNNPWGLLGNLYVDYITAIGDELVKIKLPSGVYTFTLT